MKHLSFVFPVLIISFLLVGCSPSGNLSSTASPTSPPPPKTASISGQIIIKGAVPQNSTVLMLQRKPGTTAYTEFDRLPAISGTAWVWTEAMAGQKYDITAAGQVNEQDKVVSNAVTVTAPASDIILTLDSNLSLPEPSEKPTLVTCGNPDETNHFNAKLSYPPVKNAKQYYLTVGTGPEANDIAAELVPAQANLAAELTANVAKDTQYYTRYAYTFCTDCNQNDPQNWSSFSPSLSFKCQ